MVPKALSKSMLPSLWVVLAMTATVGWTNAMRTGIANELETWHAEITNKAALAPNQYRILTPLIVEKLRTSAVGDVLTRAFDFDLRDFYRTLFFVCFLATLATFNRILKTWLSPLETLLGCSLLTALTSIANFQGNICVSDFVQLLLVALGFLAILRRRDLHLLWIVPIGTLNRESLLIIVAYYALIRISEARSAPRIEDRRRMAIRALAYGTILGLLWAATYAGLRLHYGHRRYFCDIIMLTSNLRDPGTWLFVTCFFFLPCAIAAPSLPVAPMALRQAAYAIVPYVLLHFVIGRVRETRLFLPLMPVVLPLMLMSLRKLALPGKQEAGDEIEAPIPRT